MKRLQIMIEEELDQLLAVRAHEQRRSKAAIIRQLVRDELCRTTPSIENDALWEMVGRDDYEPDRSIDDVVYR